MFSLRHLVDSIWGYQQQSCNKAFLVTGPFILAHLMYNIFLIRPPYHCFNQTYHKAVRKNQDKVFIATGVIIYRQTFWTQFSIIKCQSFSTIFERIKKFEDGHGTMEVKTSRREEIVLARPRLQHTRSTHAMMF